MRQRPSDAFDLEFALAIDLQATNLLVGTDLTKIVLMLSTMEKVLKLLQRSLPAFVTSGVPIVFWRDFAFNQLHQASVDALDLVELLIGFASQ